MDEATPTLADLKPMPNPTPDTAPYWDALREHKLVLQRCSDCGVFRHYPRPLCEHCLSFDHTWEPASGRGSVHSWTETHHAFNPGFKGELPYVLVTVDLEENVRLQLQLRDAGLDDLRIGLPVRIDFEAVNDQLTVPVARLA
ncbi:MAG: Zn-ribbon domain-containing OB-fold protein [Pseudomonadota bacterium]